MFYILRSSFIPNTASANRALAYYRAMDEFGVEATVVLLSPDDKRSRVGESFKNIKIVYCWENQISSNKIIRKIYYYLNLLHFIRRVKSGDKVYIYGSSQGIHQLVKKKGVEVYLEVTEHPEVYPIKTRMFDNRRVNSINDCIRLDGLIVISNNLKDYYIEQGLNKQRVHIVNMIVDYRRFEGLRKTPSMRYICYSGNGNNRKDRVDELIKVFRNISLLYPDIKLVIVGPTKQVFKTEKDNVELVRELGIEDKVVFKGVLPAKEVSRVLINAEVLVLDRPDTLQNKAGFPTKLGEYLLSANPVVVSRVGDIPLFLKDKHSALLVDPGDTIGLQKCIIWLLENQDLAIQIGQNGREVAKTFFNSLSETKKLLSIIHPGCEIS